MTDRKASRLDQAIALRDAALLILRTVGWSEPDNDGRTLLVWRNDTLHMLHRTPFQRMPPLEGEFVRKAIAYGIALPKQLGYGLDIWQWPGGKKLNIEWDDKDTVELVSFKRGPWEAEILQLAASLPSLRTGTAP